MNKMNEPLIDSPKEGFFTKLRKTIFPSLDEWQSGKVDSIFFPGNNVSFVWFIVSICILALLIFLIVYTIKPAIQMKECTLSNPCYMK